MLLESGNRVPADLLFVSTNLSVDRSLLTGRVRRAEKSQGGWSRTRWWATAGTRLRPGPPWPPAAGWAEGLHWREHRDGTIAQAVTETVSAKPPC